MEVTQKSKRLSIRHIARSCFSVTFGGKTVYFEPRRIPKGYPRADFVLTARDRAPQFRSHSPGLMARTEAKVYYKAENGVGRFAVSSRSLRPGEGLDFGEMKFRAVPTYSIHRRFHPKKNNRLGFLVECGDIRLYYSADVGFIPEMAEVTGVDYALMPLGGKRGAARDEAVDAARLMRPRSIIPIDASSDEAEAFKSKVGNFVPDVHVITLNAGSPHEI